MNVLRVSVDDIIAFRWRSLTWAVLQQTHEEGFVAFLNNNTIAYPNDPFPNRLFVGRKRVIPFSGESTNVNAFQTVYTAHRERPSFLVGYFGYDLKNQLEALSSRNSDRLGFPDVYFAEPEWIIDFEESVGSSGNVVITGDGDPDEVLKNIAAYSQPSAVATDRPNDLTTHAWSQIRRVIPENTPSKFESNKH